MNAQVEGKQIGNRESKRGGWRLDRECVSVAYVLVVLYERRVAKPLSICNPDGDAFTPRFTGMGGGRKTEAQHTRSTAAGESQK